VLILFKGCEGEMKIGSILKENQPEVHKKLRKKKKRRRRDKEKSLSFNDFKSMMKHSSYKRSNGAIKQVKYD
jgi:hypothetical protein